LVDRPSGVEDSFNGVEDSFNGVEDRLSGVEDRLSGADFNIGWYLGSDSGHKKNSNRFKLDRRRIYFSRFYERPPTVSNPLCSLGRR